MKNIRVSPLFGIVFALGILVIPVRWLISWIIAAFIHELFHYLALRLCQISVISVEIGPFGAVIQTGSGSEKRMLLSVLAGPLGGLLLFCFARVFPRIAICGLAQSLFNMLPIYPLDGGRAVRHLLCMLFQENTAHNVSNVIEKCGIFLCSVAVIYISIVSQFSFWSMLCVAIVVYKNKKIPCKQSPLGVQ